MGYHPRDSERRLRLVRALRGETPRRPDPCGPPRAPRRLEVFAAGTDLVQLTWSALGPGPVRFTARPGDVEVEVGADGGAGAVTLEGLPSDSTIEIDIAGRGLVGRSVPLRARTLPAPGGERLARIATVSDVHLGARATGFLHTIAENPAPDVPHPSRCLVAAVTEAADHGADELIVKGDLVDESTPALWSLAAELLEGAPPSTVLIGNHERSSRNTIDPVAGATGAGLTIRAGVSHVDRPGVRLVFADSARTGSDRGRISDDIDAVGEAARTDLPVLTFLHHQLDRFRLPTHLPPGIPGPQSRRLVEALRRGNPDVVVSSGHTHRHRRRVHRGVTCSEVGSTKDFPGTWASYDIHEGGLVQVVHRISRPDCIRWTDVTRRAAAGIWQHWSPGSLDDRCFVVPWRR